MKTTPPLKNVTLTVFDDYDFRENRTAAVGYRIKKHCYMSLCSHCVFLASCSSYKAKQHSFNFNGGVQR